MVNRNRIILPFLIISIAFIFVAARLFYIQIWNHQELKKRVQKLICRERPEQPCRGMILDNQGRILAMSVRKYTMFADFKQISNIKETERKLRSINIKLPHILNSRSSYVPLIKNLDMQTMQKIKALNLPGIGFIAGYQRLYPENKMACHLLGVVGRDGAGLEGMELLTNAYLSGDKVKQTRYRDGRGREISEKLIDPDLLKGYDVYLTIDHNLQFIVEQEIEAAWEESKSKKVITVIQDSNTGEILALACKPAFNPNDFSGDWNKLKNSAISDIFEPGSTFKLVTAGAALQEKAVSLSESIWCEDGKYKVFKHTISDHEKKGFLNLEQIIQYSSNIGTAKIGQRLGKDKLYYYIRQFGFSSPTGIDLPGEAKGLLKPPESWSGLSVPVISFGQEIGVTAIQMINAYSAIANGGTLIEPRVIKEIRDSAGNLIFAPEKRVIRKVISDEVSENLKKMLVAVVEKGTGQMAKVPGYSVGGKTGTAQKRDPETRRYSTKNYVASFCGIIPMSKPRLTILVILDEPQGDYWGSSRAGPVFNKIASRAVKYLQIDPDQAQINICSTKQYTDLNETVK